MALRSPMWRDGLMWGACEPRERLRPQRFGAVETMFTWWARWQRINAEAVVELRDKHKVEMHTTPNDIHKAFLDAWERIAARESEKNPLFKEVYDDLKNWASVSVPVKRFYFPAYSIAADYYWADKK